MITQLEKRPAKGQSKEHWRFSVTLTGPGRYPFSVRGWRYWPDTRDLLPPTTHLPSGVTYWIVAGETDGFDLIRDEVERLLGCAEHEPWDDNELRTLLSDFRSGDLTKEQFDAMVSIGELLEEDVKRLLELEKEGGAK